MDDAILLERMLAGMRAWVRLLGRSSEGARVLEHEGVVGSCVPAVPERSVLNSVLYEREEALAATLDELADAYDKAGIEAWTVWVPEADRAAARGLEAAGHRLDASPRAMAAELTALPGAVEVDWAEPGDAATLAAINDAAYPYPGAPFTRAHQRFPVGAGRVYVARVDGRPASCLMAVDHEGDCGIYWVATIPEVRGRGLAFGLMGHALAEARGRGCETTSLQATKMGAPVYTRLGYRVIGTLEMWERRGG